MFGYVRVEKGELKVKEFEAYRGLYCSLCRALGKRYGIFARLILSYDMTFLTLIRFSAFGILPAFRPGRCPFNPAKKCSYCTNGDDQFDFVCAAAILMFYYKVRDNITDGSFFRRLAVYLLLPYAALKRRKAKRLFPAVDTIIAEAMRQQTQVEEKRTTVFDEAAHPSADALGKLFVLGMETDSRALYRFGYFVGRWVYLMDAADDLQQDLKHHNFNVFIQAFSLQTETLTQEQNDAIRETLNASIGAAIAALEETDCRYLRPIIENILYDGLYAVMERILKGEQAHERSL